MWYIRVILVQVSTKRLGVKYSFTKSIHIRERLNPLVYQETKRIEDPLHFYNAFIALPKQNPKFPIVVTRDSETYFFFGNRCCYIHSEDLTMKI